MKNRESKMPNKTKLKKLNVNLLKDRLSSDSSLVSKLPTQAIFSLLHISLDEEKLKSPSFIILSLSLIATLIFLLIDTFLFLSNFSLKHAYNEKLQAIKPYQDKISMLNNQVSSLKAEYSKLNKVVSSFKDINNIFDNYYNTYSSLYNFLDFVLDTFTSKDVYPSSISINTNPISINPNTVNISVDADSFKNSSPFSTFKYINGCYDINIKGLCVNSIQEKDTLKVNKFGFAYFDKSFNLTANFISLSQRQGGLKDEKNK
ncbi:MAG: hypothetical protein ACP5S8_08015 [Hydrogenobaculum sp.]